MAEVNTTRQLWLRFILPEGIDMVFDTFVYNNIIIYSSSTLLQSLCSGDYSGSLDDYYSQSI